MRSQAIRTALSAVAILTFAPSLPCAAADTPAASSAGSAVYPTEYWTNDKDGWSVKTAACGNALCAWLVDFKLKPEDAPGYQPIDRNNPDKTRRQDKLCEHQLMGGFHPSDDKDATWDGGWIYDPDSGTTYSGKITMVDRNTVKLRGFVGISLLGRTLELRRQAAISKSCAG
ncbi:MAG TPA: DUF2147 domain-containing protein [Alphaproteobacteria bacterium]|nr:DUF2147 domain-containing protein [Alphaproteobacteria bacterium]